MTKGMPFLYELIKSRLSKENHTNSNTTSPDDDDAHSMVDFEENEELDEKKGTRAERRAHLVNFQYAVFVFIVYV
jgi:hypothetical protein